MKERNHAKIINTMIVITVIIIIVFLNFLNASASSQYSDDEIIVVVTPTGECYHNKNCEWVGDNYRKITLEQAKDEGYRDCKVCKVFGPDMEVVKKGTTTNDELLTVILVAALSLGAVLMAITKHNE